MAELAPPELKPDQIQALKEAMEDPLQKIADYQAMYIDSDFDDNLEPYDTDVTPPAQQKGKPRTYLQVLISREPLPNGTGGELPAPILPNRLDNKPSDQRFSPADLRWVFGKMPFAFEVSSKEREGAIFYAVTFKMRIDNHLYQYTKDVLPGVVDPGPDPKWEAVVPFQFPDPCD